MVKKKTSKAKLDDKVDILFCVPGNNFSDLFLQSFAETMKLMQDLGLTWRLSNGYSCELTRLRNMLARADAQADYHMWIDSDMVWGQKQIVQLFSNDQDIVSGCYVNLDNEWVHETVNGEYTGVQEASHVGFGFVRYNTKILKDMKYPFFYNKQIKEGYIGEDICWCENAQEAGYKVYVDHDCRIGHEKTTVL